MSVLQLAYVSSPTFQITPETIAGTIKDILAASRKNNPKLNVTGCLLFTNKYFFQIIEGKQSTIQKMCSKIFKDPRHDKVCLVYDRITDERCFSNWAMSHIKIDSSESELLNYYLFDPKLLHAEKMEKLITLMQEAATTNTSISIKTL